MKNPVHYNGRDPKYPPRGDSTWCGLRVEGRADFLLSPNARSTTREAAEVTCKSCLKRLLSGLLLNLARAWEKQS